MASAPPPELRPESVSGSNAPGASTAGLQAGGESGGPGPAMSPAPIPVTVSTPAPAPAPFSQTTSLASMPAVPVDPTGRSRPIGEVLLAAGLLTQDQVDRVLDHAAQKRLPFGEAAIALGLLSRAQLEQALGYQFDYPVAVGNTAVALSREVVVAFDVHDPVIDDLREVRNEIQLRWLNGSSGRRAIAILSTQSGDGRSFVASNLAVTFAQGGSRTLLIDADMRGGRLHELFGATNAGGLAAFLSGRVALPSIHAAPGIRNLALIASGGAAPNAGDLLARPALQALLEHCERQFDVVIVDTPAASEGPDAKVTAAQCGGAVVVVRQDHTPLENVAQLVKSLKSATVTVVGTVLLDH
ncbi:MAG: polysaccharide biosynthesis tyrosine autokinase [Burkholderiales bacterium]|jgi:receptor protein-tyrosine kinase